MAAPAPTPLAQAPHEAADWGTPFRLFVLLRTAQLEDGSPEQVAGALDSFLAALGRVLDREGRATIRHRSGYLFLNGRRLPVDFRAFHATRFLVELFRSIPIGGLRFSPGVTRQELLQAVRALLAREHQDRLALAAGLMAAQVAHVKFLAETRLGRDPLAARARDAGRRTRETQFRSLFITKRILSGIREGNGVDARLAKRILHGVVDLILADHASLADLTRLSEFGGFLLRHSLNVAVVAVVIGQRMGLPRRLLGSLGAAALFHDFGRLEQLPVVAPPAAAEGEPLDEALAGNRPLLDEEEGWGEADGDSHAMAGFLAMIRDRPLSDMALRSAVAAREHHFGVDGCGLKDAMGEPLRPMLLSRIIAVADAYDTLCERPGPGGSGPAEALRRIQGPLAGRFDPEVVKALGAALARSC